MKRLLLLCILALSLGTAGFATAQSTDEATLMVGESDDIPPFLTDSEGMTLYIFTKDEKDAGTSVCNDDCATNWPPFFVEDATLPEGVDGELSVVTRDDGSEQVAFNGMPLYYWANDAAAGDTTGHEVGDVWFVAAVESMDHEGMASPVAMADGAVMVGQTDELGEFLADGEGMTLYIFTNDESGAGTSVCNDDCAANWPPFYAENATLPDGVPGELSVVTRDDGSEQLAYNGMPLYYWVNDAAAGDTTGHEVGDVWFVAEVGEPEDG